MEKEQLKIGEEKNRFKVEAIEKYEEMIDEIEQEIADTSFSIGCNILFSSITLFFVFFSLVNLNSFGAIWDGIATLISSTILEEKLYKLSELLEIKRNYNGDLSRLKDKLKLNESLEKEQQKTKTL